MSIVQDALSSFLQGLMVFSVPTIQVWNVIEANSSASFTIRYRRGWHLSYKGWLKREDGAGSLCTVFWFHYEDKHLELKGII